MEEISRTALSFIINEPVYIIGETKTESNSTEIKSGSQKDILILISPEEESESEFLTKVLSAVNISQENALTSVADINLSGSEITKVISFGREIPETDLYKVEEIAGKMVMKADRISKIKTDVVLKKKLWAALKEMFKV